MELFKKTGPMALGSRLRMMAENITSQASLIYEMYGLDLKPKWFPVFFTLADGKSRTVTAIASEIGHTHPSVSNILKEMKASGLVTLKQDKGDSRQTLAALTPKARQMALTLDNQCTDVQVAVNELCQESSHDLWSVLAEWERLLAEVPFAQRVANVKRQREQDEVQIVRYDDAKHHEAFRVLNEQWIKDLFGVVEEADHYELDHPVQNIIDKGGSIFIATLNGKPVGTFALMRCAKPEYDFELVKFAVSPGAQGNHIGSRLIDACLTEARRKGGYRLFIESNYKCAAAVHLYEKYGFKHLKVEHSEYARCDVQMQMILQ